MAPQASARASPAVEERREHEEPRRRRARGRRDVVDDDALKQKKVSALAAALVFSGDGRPKSCEARTGEACVAGLRHRCEAVAARASAHKTLGQRDGGGGHLGAARGREAARRHAIRLARLRGCQHQIRGHFTSRSACVCSFFRAKRAKSLFSAPRNCSENGFFDTGNLPCRAYMHLKFERPRCFWCRDRAPEPVLLKIRT